MQVTIMTDASHCHTHNVAGIGYWIVSERGKHGGGAILQGTVKNSYEAEYKAVANALCIALRSGIAHKGDSILIQLDNMGVINCLKKRTSPKTELAPIDAYIWRMAKENNLLLKIKHVKAHTNTKDKRSISNMLCDKRAKEAMRIAREKAQDAME